MMSQNRISYEAMDFILSSNQPAPYCSQIPAVDVSLSQPIDRFSAAQAYLKLILVSLRVATK